MLPPRGADPRGDAALAAWLVAARVAGGLVVAYLGWRVWQRGYTTEAFLHGLWPGGAVLGFLAPVDLVFHEAGHWIFAPFGEFMHVLGGSLNQVLIPVVCTVAFFAQQRYASAAVALFWTGENLTSVALYAADGRDRVLPLLGDLGRDAHDWGRLLTWLGLSDRAERVGAILYGAGILTIVAAVLLMALDALLAWQEPRGVVDRFQHRDPT